jgi:hypothetical protein
MLGICLNTVKTVKQKFEMFSPLSFGNDLRGKDWIMSDLVGLAAQVDSAEKPLIRSSTGRNPPRSSG